MGGIVAGLLHKVLAKCVVGNEFEDDCDITNYKAEIAGIVSRGETIHERTRLIADIDSYEYAVVELVGRAIRDYVQNRSDASDSAHEPGVQYWYTGLYHYWWWDCEYGRDWLAHAQCAARCVQPNCTAQARTVVRVDALWGLRIWVGGTNVDAIDVLNCPTGCADLMEWVRRSITRTRLGTRRVVRRRNS